MTDRFDRDRTFKFQVAFVALVALAGFGAVQKLVQRSRKGLDPKDYIPKDPPPLPPPIDLPGTTVAARRSRRRPATSARTARVKKR
jgi:hypothetical protein